MLPGANCTWWFKWTNVCLLNKSCIEEDWTTEEATENNKTPELSARASHSSAHNTSQIESLLLCPRLLCCLWLQQLQLTNEDMMIFLSLWNRWMWRLETAAAAMVELFGGVLGLNLLCLAEVDWGSQKTWRQQQEEIKPRYIKFVGQRPERAFWGHFGYPEWVCLGRKGGKDWYFIWGGSEILDYIHYRGRRGVNVYQRIRKEFPLSLSAPTICLL